MSMTISIQDEMKQWEYRSEFIALLYSDNETPDDFILPYGGPITNLWQKKLLDALNKIGDEGWELVTISPEIISGESLCSFALFKRPKKQQGERP